MRKELVRVVRAQFSQMSVKDRRTLKLLVLAGCSLNFLDIIGLGIIGLLLSISVRGIKSESVGELTQTVLNFLGLGSLSLEIQATTLGVLAIILFVSKSIFAVSINRKTLHLLSDHAATKSIQLFENITMSNLSFFQRHSRQEILHSTLVGIRYLAIDVVGGAAALVIDVTFLFLVLATLLVIDWSVALFSLLIFGTAGLLIYRYLSKHVLKLSTRTTETSIELGQIFTHVLDLQREIQLSGTENIFVEKFSTTRRDLSRTTADLALIPNIGKYLIETLAITSGIFIAGIQFALKDAVHAIALLTIFLAAGSRIGPAVLRIQNTVTQIKAGLGYSEKTMELMLEFSDCQDSKEASTVQDSNFIAKIEFSDVSFGYVENEEILRKINLEIEPGTFVAVVGNTGSGKSTLFNLLLGFLKPNYGTITISGVSPEQAKSNYPAHMALVPQEINLISGSIFENIALGAERSEPNVEKCREVLRKVKLLDFVEQMPNKLDSDIGELGNLLSGGQKQRVGIARALFFSPKIILLDEATSSLDGLTEESVISEILDFRSHSTTLIVIAHRLSTIRSADRVIYLDNGEIKGDANFESLRKMNSEFEAQVRVMGIK
jgi:ABC-type multidrug transport system fused ATPase/permease subunit